MTCLGAGLFASILFGTLRFLDLNVYFLHQLREVFFRYFSNRFLISCSFSSSSGTLVMRMLECLKLSHRLLTLSLFFWIIFSCYSDWWFFGSLWSKSLIWFSASSTLLLFPCKLFFISISVSFVSHWIFFTLLKSSLGTPSPGFQCQKDKSPQLLVAKPSGDWVSRINFWSLKQFLLTHAWTHLLQLTRSRLQQWGSRLRDNRGV